MKMLRTAIVSALCSLFFVCAHSFAEEPLEVQVSPKVIDIGATYNGTVLSVRGEIPAGSEAVVQFMGEPSDLDLKEKGRAFGFLWMNMRSVTFKSVPSVCIVCGVKNPSAPVDPPGKGEGAEADLRRVGLKPADQVEHAEAGRPLPVHELIKLKKQEGLYREIPGNVTCTRGADGNQEYRAEIPVPSRLSPGSYSVRVFAVKDGNVIAGGEQSVSARLVGFPAFLANLAFHNGVLYGILAVASAILAGLAIGLVFQGKGGH